MIDIRDDSRIAWLIVGDSPAASAAAAAAAVADHSVVVSGGSVAAVGPAAQSSFPHPNTPFAHKANRPPPPPPLPPEHPQLAPASPAFLLSLLGSALPLQNSEPQTINPFKTRNHKP